MAKFTIQDIAHRVGGSQHLQRVLGLHATIVRRSFTAVAARVGSPFDAVTFDVMVSTDLDGRCACAPATQGAFCDHAAAAALEWILEGGPMPETAPIQATPIGRFT